MTDHATHSKVPGKFSSISNVHWAAGLTVAFVLSFITALIVTGITNEWAILVVLTITNVIIAAAVGFAVRFTSSASPNNTFLAAFATTGLGVHIPVMMAGDGFDEFGWHLFGAYLGSPFSAYVFFFGIIGALVATMGRRA